MKLVVAIIRPEKLEAVQAALNEHDVYLMTVTDVRGCGRQRGYTEVYRGTEFQVRLLPKLKLEIAVNDAFVEAAMEAIVHAAGRRRRDRSATARYSSCRWTTACASAPANAARRRLDRERAEGQGAEGKCNCLFPPALCLLPPPVISPGAGHKARLPVRQKLYCEALPERPTQ